MPAPATGEGGDRPIRGDEEDTRALAASVRDACIERLLLDTEDARLQGLCSEGAFEYALDRLRHAPIDELLASTGQKPDSTDSADLGADT